MTDTPGFQFTLEEDDSLYQQINQNLSKTLTDADLIFFLVDGKKGICSADLNIREYLRKNFAEKKVILLANKCDDEESQASALNEVYQFWDKRVVPISAQNGDNIIEVWKSISREISEEAKENYKQLLKK